jgi:hypothetical protein
MVARHEEGNQNGTTIKRRQTSSTCTQNAEYDFHLPNAINCLTLYFRLTAACCTAERLKLCTVSPSNRPASLSLLCRRFLSVSLVMGASTKPVRLCFKDQNRNPSSPIGNPKASSSFTKQTAASKKVSRPSGSGTARGIRALGSFRTVLLQPG